MARTKQSEAKQIARDANRKAQQEVAWRRRESGLELVKLYLDTETVMVIEEIAHILGYKYPHPGTKKRLETLSECVTYCVHQLDIKRSETKPKTRFAMEYKRIFEIARYRLDKKEDFAKIANFMTEAGYLRPSDILKCHKASVDLDDVAKVAWHQDDVEELLAKELLKKYLQELNSLDRY